LYMQASGGGKRKSKSKQQGQSPGGLLDPVVSRAVNQRGV